MLDKNKGLLGNAQVGVDRRIQQASEALLLALTKQQSVGSALAAILCSPVSEALLRALEDAVNTIGGAPIVQVSPECQMVMVHYCIGSALTDLLGRPISEAPLRSQ